MKTWIVIILLFTAFVAHSQRCNEVLVIGRVQDSIQPQGFYNLMVINKTTQRGVFGNANGSFSVYANEGDVIAFSVKGYTTQTIIVRSDSDCQMRLQINLALRVQEFDEVVVYPVKSLKEIKEEREQLSMRETRTVTGVDVLQSPITALYERFSKKAQSQRLVAEMEFKDNQRKVVKELLRLYVSYDVVYLEEEEFESFIYFLNMGDHFLKTASDYELIIYIKDKLEHYKSLNPEKFK
jgi:hypothetical protein